MAKTRPGASSKKGRSKKSQHKNNPRSDGPASASTRPRKSPKALVQDAEAAMTQGDVQVALVAAQRAQKALEDASSGNANNNIVVDGVGLAAVYALVGEIYLENGDVDDARAALDRSVLLDPEGTLPEALGGGVDKFLYLAQLSEEGGRDSIKWFERGAGALRTLAGRIQTTKSSGGGGGDGSDSDDDDEQQDELDTLNGKLAQILCAMAEVWMTDLSYESDCEQQCEKLTTEATLVEPLSSEVWQTLANVRISQSRDADARAALQRSLALWETLPPEHPQVPAFSVRVSLARMLMTVSWLTKAIDVTTNLLREDEQSVEVWYLAGYANHLLGQQLKEAEAETKTGTKADEQNNRSWRGAWVEARRCLGRCLRRFEQQQYEDDRLGEHATELFRELEATVGPAPQKEKDEEDYEEEDEDEEWEDDEERGEEDEEDEEGEDEDDNDEDEEMEG